MAIIKYIQFLLLGSILLTSSSYGCTFNYQPQKYLDVMKIHGKKNKDLKVYEAIYGLSYTGKDHFRLYNEKMELLASQQGDSLCTFDKQNKSFCSPAQNIMLDLRIIHNFDKKRKLTLFIQINDEPAEAYTFKRRRVKATEEHHEQKYIQGWNICYEAE